MTTTAKALFCDLESHCGHILCKQCASYVHWLHGGIAFLHRRGMMNVHKGVVHEGPSVNHGTDRQGISETVGLLNAIVAIEAGRVKELGMFKGLCREMSFTETAKES